MVSGGTHFLLTIQPNFSLLCGLLAFNVHIQRVSRQLTRAYTGTVTALSQKQRWHTIITANNMLHITHFLFRFTKVNLFSACFFSSTSSNAGRSDYPQTSALCCDLQRDSINLISMWLQGGVWVPGLLPHTHTFQWNETLRPADVDSRRARGFDWSEPGSGRGLGVQMHWVALDWHRLWVIQEHWDWQELKLTGVRQRLWINCSKPFNYIGNKEFQPIPIFLCR